VLQQPKKKGKIQQKSIAKMITRFITDVTTRFNPFSPSAKAARLFLSFLPPNARQQGMNISAQLLPRSSTEKPTLYIKFSTLLKTTSSLTLIVWRGQTKAQNANVRNRGRQGNEHRLREDEYQDYHRGG